jgi:electron transfer flavoprotein beta subunit
VFLNSVVCVKHIPDPNVPGEMDGDVLKRDGVQGVLDPGDEFGVEAALLLKEAHGGEVTVVSMGPEPAQEAVRRALSMGADRSILVTDDALRGADALITARVLAAAIKRVEYDIVIAGVESTDGYTGTMPSSLAEFLGLPQLTFANFVEVEDGVVTVHRQTSSGYHVVECSLPALVTVTAGVNEPRYPSFKGIMAAKKKPHEQLSLADLGVDADQLSCDQRVEELTSEEERRAGEVVADNGEGASRIADFLKAAKVI